MNKWRRKGAYPVFRDTIEQALAAAAAYRQALTLFDREDYQRGIILVLEGLASVAAGRGERARAVELFGAADALRERLRATFPSAGEPSYDRHMLQARATLNGRAYEAAYKKGQTMSLERIPCLIRVVAILTPSLSLALGCRWRRNTLM
jgi:hypothetical protein